MKALPVTAPQADDLESQLEQLLTLLQTVSRDVPALAPECAPMHSTVVEARAEIRRLHRIDARTSTTASTSRGAAA